MNTDILFLEVSRTRDKIKIGLHHDQSAWTYEEITAPMQRIDQKCYEMIETINRINHQKTSKEQSFESVKSMGRLFSDLLLTPDIKHRLKINQTQPLIFRLDEQLVHIPWELLCIDDELLCLKFITGRELKTRQPTQRNVRTSQKPFQMWIITHSGTDLKEATKEGITLCRLMDKANQYYPTIESVHHSEVEVFDVYEKISDYDFIHFAGHADFNEVEPDLCGWKLKNGIFTASDINKLMNNSGMPYIVFSNACQSARTNAWVSESCQDYECKHSFSLANAFIIAGVHHYIGTIWEISDQPGNLFATEFYNQLIAKQSIGEAVRQSRLKMIQDQPTDISWASYLLYGPPCVTYFHDDTQPQTGIHTTNNNKEKNNSPIAVNALSDINSSPQSDLRTLWPQSEKKSKSITNTWIWFFSLFVILSIIYGGYTVKTIRSNDHTIHFETLKLLENKIKERNQNVKHLFAEYQQKVPMKQVTDNWTFGPLAMAMVFDSASFRHETDQIILHAIQSRIMESNPNIVILDRRSFDHILNELLHNPPKESLLYFPSILLSLALNHYDNNILVLMQLDDIQQGKIIGLCHVTLTKHAPILKQKNQLTDDLIAQLDRVIQHYPIRGKITNVKDQSVMINIGEYEGVKIDTQFRIIDHEALLKVTSIKTHESHCVLSKSQNSPIHKNMKIEQLVGEK